MVVPCHATPDAATPRPHACNATCAQAYPFALSSTLLKGLLQGQGQGRRSGAAVHDCGAFLQVTEGRGGGPSRPPKPTNCYHMLPV